MTAGDTPRRRENAFALARRLLSGVVGLARLELQRGRQEVTEALEETRVGAVLLAGAFVIGVITLVSLDVAFMLGVIAIFAIVSDVVATIIVASAFALLVILYVILGAGRAFVISWVMPILVLLIVAAFAVPPYLGFRADWHVALFVVTFQASIVGLLVFLGVRRLRSPVPQETIDAVKEDIEWAKRLLRRE